MNEERVNDPPHGPFEMLREPAVRTYLFIAFAALLVYYMLMASRAGDLGSLLTLCFAAAGLLARWVISPALFLIFTTYLLFDPHFAFLLGELVEPRGYGGRRFFSTSSPLQFSDLLLGAAILTYLMAQFRLLSFVYQSMPDDAAPRRKGQPEPLRPRRPMRLFADRELGTMLVTGLICVVAGTVGWLTLVAFENNERLGGEWGLERRFARLIVFFWTVMLVALSLHVAGRYLEMRRMSRLEARLSLQDMFWQETRREQERIYYWRRWFADRAKSKPKGD